MAIYSLYQWENRGHTARYWQEPAEIPMCQCLAWWSLQCLPLENTDIFREIAQVLRSYELPLPRGELALVPQAIWFVLALFTGSCEQNAWTASAKSHLNSAVSSYLVLLLEDVWVSGWVPFHLDVEYMDILEECKASREGKLTVENMFPFSDDLSSLAKTDLHIFLSS